MRPALSRTLVGASLAALAAGAWLCQRGGARRAAAETAAPSPAAEMIVAGLGGFRSIVAEIVWFRADRLQDEGRYAELAQLSAWLTFLEPHTPEVWAYAAWNLAYNISVTMPTPADRWRWVEAGIRLLRDDGLRLNPDDPVLYRELAWTFLLKLGGPLDEAGAYYRSEWKRRVEELRAGGRLAELGLDEARMAAIDAEYGRQDWTDPLATALYWAARGLALAKTPERRRELRQIVYQALMLEARAEARFAPRALQELRTAYVENPSELLKRVIRNFRGRFGLD
ncbi:MAG: hypothetical protein ACI4RA_11595 [Kiritimatiellia bacterium]